MLGSVKGRKAYIVRQIVDTEYIDMYTVTPENFWVALEHMGRYAYAVWLMGKRKFETVLDVACANGFGCEKLAQVAEQVTGVDINADLIAEAKRRGSGKVTYHVLDMDTEDWTPILNDQRFDAITCFEAIEHLKQPERLLKRLRARLNPGGRLLLSVPSADYEPLDENGTPINPYHRHVLTQAMCFDMFGQAGFAVEHTLGQPDLNRLMRKHNAFCSRNPELESFTTASFDVSPQSLAYYIQMFAYPEKGKTEDAYSLLYILRPLKK